MSLSSLRRLRSALDWAFSEVGVASPSTSAEVQAVWTGVLRKARGESTPQHVTLMAQRVPDLALLLQALELAASAGGEAGQPYAAPRDTLLLIVGAATMMTASELVALTFGDISAADEGVRVRLPEERWVHVDSLPPIPSPLVSYASVRKATLAAGLGTGPDDPVFRATDRWDAPRARAIGKSDVTRIVKRWATASGNDEVDGLGAKWLRLCTRSDSGGRRSS